MANGGGAISEDHPVVAHYTHGALLAAIRSGVEALGKTPGTLAIEDLAPIDEFHIGGRRASQDFLGQLPLDGDTHALDVGCGLGGGARFAANRFGSRVTGIDLTAEFVETGAVLCGWVGLDERIALHHGSALDMPGGAFGVYDVMQTGDGDLTYPVPWAEAPATSSLAATDGYKRALEAAGFTLTAERSRRDFALEFFAELAAKAAAADGPPPLGLHILMDETRAEKVRNMIDNISAGRIAPVEIIARK